MHPVIFSTPWFNVYSYGLLVALSYFAGTAWTLLLVRRERLPAVSVLDMLLLQLVAGVVGSRLLFLIETGWPFSTRISFWEFEKGGLTFYGAVLSGLFVDLLFLRFKKIPFWRVMDCAGNALLLGIGMGRLGCFLNGCCYGIPCHWPWGIVFPKIASIPLHPTQLYETAGVLLLFFLHQKSWQRRTHHGHGCIFSLSLYAGFRFLIEFWRGDNPVVALGMTLSQLISLGLLALGAIAWTVIAGSPDMRISSRVAPVTPDMPDMPGIPAEGGKLAMYPYLGHFIFPLYTYGVFLALAFLTAISLAVYHGPLLGIKTGDVLDMCVWFMLSSIIGARILYILLFPNQFPTWYSWLELQKGGLVFFGGFLATVVMIVVFSRATRIGLRNLGDLIAPSLPLGQFVGRIGCFMNGCCYGRPTDGVFGIVFPNLTDHLARHPTQLYEAVFSLLLVIWGSVMIRRRAAAGRHFPGAIWGGYVLAYGTFRFLVEFVRDDERGGFFTAMHFSISQMIALTGIAGAIFWLFLCLRVHRAETLKESVNEANQ